ncbi:PIN-like domain-containing protein, partial [Acinetobacter proteolyticus]
MNKFFLEYKDYYSLDELRLFLNDESSLIVFDTNIFLDLYSYPLDTRNSIIQSIEKLKCILWSPHHIFLEYHKNRREVICRSKKILDEIQNTLGSFTSGNVLNTSSIGTYKSSYGKFHSELTNSIQEIIDKYTPLYEELSKKLTADVESIRNKVNYYKQQDTVSLTGDDPVLNFLLKKYSDSDIGVPYSSERLSEIFKECDARFAKKIPPAFKDSGKSEKFLYRGVEYDSKYGDFIIYRQILDYCLANDIKNVFFVSNDVKRDWREPVPNQKNKYYGARKELKAEAYLDAKVENLILLDLKEYFTILDIPLSKNVVDDIEALKRFHNDKNKKLIDQRIRKTNEELERLKKLPIEDAYEEINSSDKLGSYLRELKKSYPDFYQQLLDYRQLILRKMNSETDLRSTTSAAMSSEHYNQRMSEAERQRLISESATSAAMSSEHYSPLMSEAERQRLISESATS